jgi:hypothetical protein
MHHTITLPVSGLEVELAAFSWPESRTFFEDAAKFLDGKGKVDQWVEKILTKHYPKKVLDQVMRAAPDARALYNDTVRYNQSGPEAVKNSSRSGTGAPTQTETPTAAPAAKATLTD